MGLTGKCWSRNFGVLSFLESNCFVFFFFLPGEASAVLAKAKAKAEAIRILASALTQHVRGRWVGMGGRNRQRVPLIYPYGEFLTLWTPLSQTT